MKKVRLTFVALVLLATAAQAAPQQPSVATAEQQTTVPAHEQQVKDRALQLTCYFTDVLRLTKKQAAEVRVVTYQKLQQLDPAAPEQGMQGTLLPVAQVMQQYDAAMFRILTPGQYSTFRWLEERQPVAHLLAGSEK
ncbi:hypothetical protein [Hymenobacter wooponensis]|uniref:Uncharacterized protein n=1 Tax=Hymenobacter wooponensis TaxID=1525360 RepID=A0A4Z0MKB5_9BACT|nr:hypothetical protein [Hymenobacter wooponensis]TGD79810.1 hypothetical protein EU557_16495 [Hymenobacter wooponensis]